MRKWLPLIVLLAAPALARADGNIALNARVGAALPAGDIGGGTKLGDVVGWEFPLQADLQFRFARQFSAGVYGRYAPATLDSNVSNGCSAANVSCSVSDYGVGAVAEYRFSSRVEGGPWVGASVGWEWLRADFPQSGAKATQTVNGFELGAQAGMDFELGGLSLGPWVGVAVGEYSKASTKVGGVTTSGSISDKGLHAAPQVGLRLSLVL